MNLIHTYQGLLATINLVVAYNTQQNAVLNVTPNNTFVFACYSSRW